MNDFSFSNTNPRLLRAGLIAGIFSAVCFLAVLIWLLISNIPQAGYVSRIADQLLRFHVVANSDR